MPSYTPWMWSQPHGRHYSYLLDDDGRTVLDTVWSGPPDSGTSGPAAPAHERSSTIRASAAHQQPPFSTTPLDDGDERDGDEDTKEDDGEECDDAQKEEDADSDEDGDNLTKSPEHRPRVDSGLGNLQFTFQSLNIGSSQTVGALPIARSHMLPSNHVQPYQHTTQPRYGPTFTPAPPNDDQSIRAVQGPTASSLRQEANRVAVASLPADVQASIRYNDRRFIQTDPDTNDREKLDTRYRRVVKPHHAFFFVPGRVFKMLWIEPAGLANPGRTRNSTHFSTVWLGEQAYSEIRHFVVVRNKGAFSQCIPIQTYKGRGAAKPGLVMADHGIIHTSPSAPNQLPGEQLTKYSIRVEATASEVLLPASRVNFGKAYAVEHNVKVLDIGMVTENHRYLLAHYFDAAMRGL